MKETRPRAFIAGLVHETNTFLETPTSLADFQGKGSFGRVLRESELYDATLASYPIAGMVAGLQQADWQIVPGLWSTTEPGGLVTAEAFETLAGEIIERLRNAGPVDGVCIDLHGAMVAEGVDDAEGELLARVRRVVGDGVPVTAALDLHGNITRDSVRVSDAMVAYRRYPHTDMRETGERAARLLVTLHDERAGWYKAHRRLPFLMPIHRQTTFIEPCKGLYELLENLESRPGVTSLSFLPGFPLADIPDAGPTILGYGRDPAAVDAAVATLFDAMMASEAEFHIDLHSAESGVSKAIEESKNGTVLIADVQDNAGGGGTSDTVWILEELVRQRAPDAILGLLCDSEAADAAHSVGPGARVELSLGGRRLPGHRPMRATWEVEKIDSGPIVLSGPMSRGLEVDLGKVALLRIGGVRVVVSSVRTQCHDTEYFRRFGLEPGRHGIVVVKSTNHYRADFQPLAGMVIEIEADGACRMNPARLPYRKLSSGMRLYGNGPAFGEV